ncbi:hypothetical protein, conserved [Trypanosoma brucei gambiense DAL972]|uniref:Uncharacterized protein n=1 Tax=Trypanosoma brucei gambiense (strain MHOM/CI/86/DAL972) TaxID=679716 RepID=C9ZYQ1_TRYB9|nr:hypothetical protein, conserved [Trypanosoma brucei gambiense DAL972]CBH14550.1 hypothetical protein, conserved [Trypanosoma brucei gambiense DAL972]|eukprot:XP_011776816.1 hypothetical protein, conserved [Trypanosoma brucei gambiense DAL972]
MAFFSLDRLFIVMRREQLGRNHVEKNQQKEFWIFAFRDRLAGLQAFSNCVEVADIYGNGDNKLIVADASKTLKIYDGTSLSKEIRLSAVPSAITVVFAEAGDDQHLPVIAVSCGPDVFMYRKMKPLYRFTAPCVELDEVDVSVWEQLRNGNISAADACTRLKERRMAGVKLSTRSADLLALQGTEERERFVQYHKTKPLSEQDVVTCISSLSLDRVEDGGRSCLVIGTETRHIYVLAEKFTGVHHRVRLPGVPTCIVSLGSFRVDYRIVVACRDGCVYTVKNGELADYSIHSDGAIVQIALCENLVAVATTQNTLSYYKLKGKCEMRVFLPSPITGIATLLDSASGKARGVIVALKSGMVRVYVGKTLLHEAQVYGRVTAMKFGRYGREDAALILVMQNGTLVVEMLHRNASFECKRNQDSGPPGEQDVPIPVPSLTNVFVAQAERERAYSIDMHRLFQRDLTMLRLTTAKAYLSLLSDTHKPAVSPKKTAAPAVPMLGNSVRMITSVQGLGPVFRIRAKIQSISKGVLRDLSLVVSCSCTTYKISNSILCVPFLLPSTVSTCEVLVERLDDNAIDEGICLSVTSSHSLSTLAAVDVRLPDAGFIEDNS